MDDVGWRRGPLLRLPPLVRAFCSYFGRTRDPYLVPVLLLRGEIEGEIEAVTDRLFAEVEEDLEQVVAQGELELELEHGADVVTFDYDTRLLLPALLTLGRIHELAGDMPVLRRFRDVDEDLVARGRETTEHIVRALLDGDMRDAINDREYEDFETTVRPRDRAAELAQSTLQAGVEDWFDDPDTPGAVETHYLHAVGLSETHQERDREYRDLLERYHETREVGADRDRRGTLDDTPASGSAAAVADLDDLDDVDDLAEREGDRATIADRIRDRYKHAEPIETPALFADELDLPYFATQYERVGVLYEGMLDMYEVDVGVSLGDAFKRSVVLMVIAAQIGLDDVDDYPEDRREQLTPVTAELALEGPTGMETVREIVLSYTDRAADYSSNHLTGMAIEYIRQDALDRIDALDPTETSDSAGERPDSANARLVESEQDETAAPARSHERSDEMDTEQRSGGGRS